MTETLSSRDFHQKATKIFLCFCLTVIILVFLFVGLYFLFAFPSSPSASGKCPNFFHSSTNTSSDWLLPDTVYPLHYNLTIKILLQPLLLIPNFYGREWISFIVNQRTKFIILHAKDLLLEKADISVVKIKFTEEILESQVNVEDVVIHTETQRLIIKLEECLEVNNGYFYKVYIDHFEGKIQNDGKGLYLSRYINISNGTVFLSATQFEVSEARKMFPCFDEPRFKANFTISVVRHKDMISLSNMHQIKSEERGDFYVQDYYATSIKMSTYLVAVVVCDFPFKENVSKSGVRIRAYARSDLLNDVDYALKTAQLMLDHYEEYFQYDYPLIKLDMIALPDFVHGAMENWGLVTFRESTMLYNSELGTVLNKETVTMIVGHELAHQWFGNLVTMRWWTDLWLNEGFAHYMGYVVAEAVYPQETMDYSFLVSNPLEALKLDSMESTHAILMDVHHPNEIIQLFDIITYKKGACLVKMLHKNFGPETFRDGLRVRFSIIFLYFLFFHQIASHELFRKDSVELIIIETLPVLCLSCMPFLSHSILPGVFQTLCLQQYNIKKFMAINRNDEYKKSLERQNLTITLVMDNWIKTSGYPVVTLTRNYDTNSVALSQQRMKISPWKSENREAQDVWYVPLTYSDSSKQAWNNPDFIWLKERNGRIQHVKGEAKWIIANINLNGFYRVNYDLTNWLAIIDQLYENHTVEVFTPQQRAQILSDSFELSIAGTLDITLAFNLSKYLINEMEYLPWMTATKNFLFIDMFMQTVPEYSLFLDFMQKLLSKVYAKFGWEKVENEPKYTSYLRFLALEQSCHYKTPDCLNKTANYLQQWIKKGGIPKTFAEVKQIIKCYGLLQNKDGAFTNFVLSELKDMKSTMCSDDPEKLEWILSNTINGTQIRVWNLNELIRSASLTEIGRKVAWNFVKNNWKYIYETLNEVSGETSIIFTRCSQPENLTELTNFMAEHNMQLSWRKFIEAKETLENNIRWRKENLKKIIDWLREYEIW